MSVTKLLLKMLLSVTKLLLKIKKVSNTLKVLILQRFKHFIYILLLSVTKNKYIYIYIGAICFHFLPINAYSPFFIIYRGYT